MLIKNVKIMTLLKTMRIYRKIFAENNYDNQFLYIFLRKGKCLKSRKDERKRN